MKKLLLLLTIVIVSLCSFAQPGKGGRIRSECGFMTSQQAFNQAKSTFFSPVDESVSVIAVTQTAGGAWCYTIAIACDVPGFPPLPTPLPLSKINDTRSWSKCGYSNQNTALQAVTSVILQDDETALSCIRPDPNNTGRYCYEITITCNQILMTNKDRHVINILPEPRSIPVLAPTTTCTKTLYGPNAFVGYASCQDAENGAAGWLQGKTSMILQAVEPYVWWEMEYSQWWGVKITYITSGSFINNFEGRV
jgi:hypothetical protein